MSNISASTSASTTLSLDDFLDDEFDTMDVDSNDTTNATEDDDEIMSPTRANTPSVMSGNETPRPGDRKSKKTNDCVFSRTS